MDVNPDLSDKCRTFCGKKLYPYLSRENLEKVFRVRSEKQKGTSQVVKKPVSQKPIMPTPSDTPKPKSQSKSVVIPPLPDDIVGKHHWIWYDFKTGQPRCELTPPSADRYIPDAFKQSQSSGNVSSSHTQGAGINLSSSSFSGNPIPEEGFAHGSALLDDFKLWLSRHPGLSIDEALHRYRDEQKAKQRRNVSRIY
ncbi:MAG: hypothetical protein K2M88_07815 [Muribaculaceae bacterium]|nr:hypothetical protein [Muribaculaceae bacterium]